MGGTIGGVIGANQAEREGQYAQFQAETNARFAERDAAVEIESGTRDAAEYGKKVKDVIASQKVSYAASGIDVSDSGSAQEVMSETAKFGKIDQLTIKNNAWNRAWGLKFEAMQNRFQGEVAVASARNRGRGMLVSGIAGDAATMYSIKQTTSEKPTKTTKG